MAEEKQDDLSMEDILSSIKNILTEDNALQPVVQESKPIEVAEEKQMEVRPIAAKVLEPQTAIDSEPEDDVFQLSKSMMIDETDPFNIAAKEEKLEADNDDLDLSLDFDIDDLQLPNFDDIEEKAPQAVPQPIISQPILDEDINNLLDTNIDVDADPFDIEHEESNNEDIFNIEAEPETKPIFNTEPMIDIEAEPIYEPESPMVIEDNFINETVVENPYQDTTPSVFVDEETIEEVSVFSPRFEEVETQDISIPEESVNVDAVDVSANIINNFAKMFAQNHEEKPEVKAEFSKVEYNESMPNLPIGSASLTIEDMVKDVIENVVGKWVRDNLNQDVSVKEIANTEVARQTQSWLNANLPTMVEAIVKKEIARVMAKVGS